jgi:hypothetical protein
MTEIKAQLAGNFLGPRPKATYELIDGQRWQQTVDFRQFDYAYRPFVTIRSEAGGFMMYVTGFPVGIPVQPIPAP